jgi:hypothetical protein
MLSAEDSHDRTIEGRANQTKDDDTLGGSLKLRNDRKMRHICSRARSPSS